MREEITGEGLGVGWVRITCDAPGCAASIEARPTLGTWPEGWAEDARRTPARTRGVLDYCPEHAGLASA